MTEVRGVASNSFAAAGANPVAQNVGQEFDSFIRLLTAQVRNQDPLSPLDSTQFVEQLATFSALEQQVKSNASLELIAAMIGDLHAIAASDWLGQTVSVESSWAPFEGQPMDFDVTVPAEADRAVLTIRDSEGALVGSHPLEEGASSFQWTGELSNGEQAVHGGLYQFSIDTYRGDTYLGSVAPRIITVITSVSEENGRLRFETQSRLTADLDQVKKY